MRGKSTIGKKSTAKALIKSSDDDTVPAARNKGSTSKPKKTAAVDDASIDAPTLRDKKSVSADKKSRKPSGDKAEKDAAQEVQVPAVKTYLPAQPKDSREWSATQPPAGANRTSSSISGMWVIDEDGEYVYDSRKDERYVVGTNREMAQMQVEAQRHTTRLLGVSPNAGTRAAAERVFLPKKRTSQDKQQAWIQRQHDGLHERESKYRHAQHVAVLKETTGHSYQPQITSSSRAIAEAVKHRLVHQGQWLDAKVKDRDGVPLHV